MGGRAGPMARPQGVRPNAVSMPAWCSRSSPRWPLAWRGPRRAGRTRSLLLIVAAACIQLRLLCNLLDGMLAVEDGLKTKTGDLYNDLPDRIADVVILVGAGYGVRDSPFGVDARMERGRAGAVHGLRARARRIAWPDAALHRPDGQAAPDVHADACSHPRGVARRSSACRPRAIVSGWR